MHQTANRAAHSENVAGGVHLTEMQEHLPVVPLHVQLVFTEEFLVLLLFDLHHDVLSFL